MIHTVNFTTLEDTNKDLIISFAIDVHGFDINSLTLLRTLFFEEVLPEEERGVHVTLEGDTYEQEDFNMLNSIQISDGTILIDSTYRKYHLDTSKLEKEDIEDIVKVLKKQNYDSRFKIQIA